MASLKDIAEQAGVSARTVSRTLSGKGYVAETSRQRVLEAVELLNYQPNLAARRLKTGKSYEIGVILGSSDELQMAKLAAFETRLRAQGYSVHILFQPGRNDSPSDENSSLEFLFLRQPAAVAVLSVPSPIMQPMAEQFQAQNLPYVAIDYDNPADAIRIDRQQGVYEAVHYLAKQGRRQIAYGGFREAGRLPGYNRAIRELGQEPIRHLISEPMSGNQYALGRQLADRILSETPQVDAIQVFSDVMATGLLAGLHERGLRVPEDIAVIGFDDRYVAALSWPALTTVAQPNAAVGKAAADMLLAKITGGNSPDDACSITLPTRLVVRNSA